MTAAPDNTWIYALMAVAVVICIGGYFILKGRKGKEFKPVDFKKATIADLKEAATMMGSSTSNLMDYLFGGGGQLLLGYNKVAEVDRAYELEGEFNTQKWDAKTRSWIWGEDKKHHLIVLRARSKSFIWRYLGMKKRFFILDTNRLIACDLFKRRWSVRPTELFLPYGDVFVQSDAGMEFIDDLSIKRQKESTMMALENYGPRIVFLSAQVAAKNNILSAEAEKERKRWEAPKRADDQEVLV